MPSSAQKLVFGRAHSAAGLKYHNTNSGGRPPILEMRGPSMGITTHRSSRSKKSCKSQKSRKSNRSVKSGKSGKSGKSVKSVKSGKSGKSCKSAKTTKSGLSTFSKKKKKRVVKKKRGDKISTVLKKAIQGPKANRINHKAL